MWNCVYEHNRYRREAETRQDATSTRRITPSRSGVAAREGISGVFRGSLKARGLRLMARSAGGPTFWKSRTFDSCRPLVTFSRFTVGDCDLRSPTRTTLRHSHSTRSYPNTWTPIQAFLLAEPCWFLHYLPKYSAMRATDCGRLITQIVHNDINQSLPNTGDCVILVYL